MANIREIADHLEIIQVIQRYAKALDEYHAAPPHRRHGGVLLKLKGHVVAARGAPER